MQRPAILDGVLERTATRFLRRIHRITHRMPVRLRKIEKQRVLVVSPHPDDEVIAIGGTLSLHQLAGSETLTLYVTHDPPEADGSILRKPEAEKVARLLGFEHRFLGFPQGSISLHEPAVSAAIAEVIRSFRPDVIYCPFPGDHHRDHMSAAACTAGAVRSAAYRGEVCSYEVWSPLWPNIGVDISAVVERKREAIACYASQVLPYADSAIGLNRYRGLKLEVPYAEAMYACEGPAFSEVCRTLAIL